MKRAALLAIAALGCGSTRTATPPPVSPADAAVVAPAPDAAPPTTADAPAATPDSPSLPPDAAAPGGAAPDAAAADTAVERPPLPPLKSRSVAYLPTYAGSPALFAGQLDYRKITHLDVAFANPTAASPVALDAPEGALDMLVAAAHAGGTKVLISIAGASGTPAVVARIAPAAVQAYVQALGAFVAAHDLDGIDVDIEDDTVSPALYGAFIAALSGSLKPKGKLLTAAVATWFADQLPDDALARMDFVNVMAYDECDDSGAPCNHAPLEVATRELDYFVKKRKLPAAKVVLGVPFYGYCWGADCGKPALTYAAIVARFPDAPGKDWIELPALKLSYNGRGTIARKVALGRANGGVMVWQVAGDAPPPESLLDVIAAGLTSP